MGRFDPYLSPHVSWKMCRSEEQHPIASNWVKTVCVWEKVDVHGPGTKVGPGLGKCGSQPRTVTSVKPLLRNPGIFGDDLEFQSENESIV